MNKLYISMKTQNWTDKCNNNGKEISQEIWMLKYKELNLELLS